MSLENQAGGGSVPIMYGVCGCCMDWVGVGVWRVVLSKLTEPVSGWYKRILCWGVLLSRDVAW